MPAMRKTAAVDMSSLGPYGDLSVKTPPKIIPKMNHAIKAISGIRYGREKTTPNPSQNNIAVMKSSPGISAGENILASPDCK